MIASSLALGSYGSSGTNELGLGRNPTVQPIPRLEMPVGLLVLDEGRYVAVAGVQTAAPGTDVDGVTAKERLRDFGRLVQQFGT